MAVQTNSNSAINVVEIVIKLGVGHLTKYADHHLMGIALQRKLNVLLGLDDFPWSLVAIN